MNFFKKISVERNLVSSYSSSHIYIYNYSQGRTPSFFNGNTAMQFNIIILEYNLIILKSDFIKSHDLS